MAYAWVIDTDHLYDPTLGCCPDQAGTFGPSDASELDMSRLKRGQGWSFRMYDDDGILYYSGRLVVSGDTSRDDEKAMFGPLQDFGTPNAGAVDIRWAWDGWESA